MALTIPGNNGERKTPFTGRAPLPAREQDFDADESGRDVRGITALSLASKGEAELSALLRRARLEKTLVEEEGALRLRAREEVRKVLSPEKDEETARAAQNQLAASLEAFDVRSRDLALRERLERCREEAGRRRRDVLCSVRALADTAAYSPSEDLRARALAAARDQMRTLSRAELAMEAATRRVSGTLADKEQL